MKRARQIAKTCGTRRAVRGLMLMEVIVSMMVLSVGIVAVSRSFSVALRARGLAQDYTDARFLASDKLAEAIAVARSGGNGSGQGEFGRDWPGFSWQATVSQSSFAYNMIIPATGSGTGENVLRIEASSFGQIVVTVKWTRRGEELSSTVAALIPPLGEIERKGVLEL